MPTTYVYSFAVWPSETWGFTRALFDYFRMVGVEVEIQFTEADFERFRSDLSHDGFTLREVQRWPHHKPEAVG